MRIVGTAVSVVEAREAARVPVDVVLMDYRLQDGTGVEATRLIKARWPSCRVLMLTGIDDDETILESIQAGADGYLTKDRAVADVVDAVRAVHRGALLLPPRPSSRSPGASPRPGTAAPPSLRWRP